MSNEQLIPPAAPCLLAGSQPSSARTAPAFPPGHRIQACLLAASCEKSGRPPQAKSILHCQGGEQLSQGGKKTPLIGSLPRPGMGQPSAPSSKREEGSQRWRMNLQALHLKKNYMFLC